MGFLDISVNDVRLLAGLLFGQDDVSSHDARYDVTSTYICYLRGIERGYISNPAVSRRKKLSVEEQAVHRSNDEVSIK